MRQPFNKYRPTRTVSSSGGGYTETLGEATLLWGIMIFPENEIKMIVDSSEDIITGDIVVTEDDSTTDQYRIVNSERMAGQGEKILTLEKVSRPIGPV